MNGVRLNTRVDAGAGNCLYWAQDTANITATNPVVRHEALAAWHRTGDDDMVNRRVALSRAAALLAGAGAAAGAGVPVPDA